MSRNFMFSWHFFFFFFMINSFLYSLGVCVLEEVHCHMTDCDRDTVENSRRGQKLLLITQKIEELDIYKKGFDAKKKKKLINHKNAP